MQRLLAACGLWALVVLPSFAQDPKMLEKVTAALPAAAPATSKQPRKVLIFSRTAGFRHSSIGIGVKAIAMMGDKTGAYTAFATEDESYFEPAKLAKFDAVYMLNTTGDCLRPKESKDGVSPKDREEMLKKSLVDFVENGKGLMGCHSATDTYRDWKAYNKMMGGAFINHPWHTKVPIKNLEPSHPLNRAFGGKDFEINDEIYQFRNDTASASERRYLLSLDIEAMKERKLDLKQAARKDNLYGVSWVSKFGNGRTFYCSLGHREEIYWNPTVLQHYLAGLQYVLGDLEVDATPKQ